MLDDRALSIGAAAFYFGLPVVLAVIAWRRKGFRPTAASIVGAITPLLVFLLGHSLAFFFSSDDGTHFVFYAMWVMGFGVYVLCLALGGLLAVVGSPQGPWSRYTVALVISFLLLSAWVFLGSLV